MWGCLEPKAEMTCPCCKARAGQGQGEGNGSPKPPGLLSCPSVEKGSSSSLATLSSAAAPGHQARKTGLSWLRCLSLTPSEKRKRTSGDRQASPASSAWPVLKQTPPLPEKGLCLGSPAPLPRAPVRACRWFPLPARSHQPSRGGWGQAVDLPAMGNCFSVGRSQKKSWPWRECTQLPWEWPGIRPSLPVTLARTWALGFASGKAGKG